MALALQAALSAALLIVAAATPPGSGVGVEGFAVKGSDDRDGEVEEAYIDISGLRDKVTDGVLSDGATLDERWDCDRGKFVKRLGPRLELAGSRFIIHGFNQYDMVRWGAHEPDRHRVAKILSDAAAMGMNSLRTWAFNDGDRWLPIQVGPGKISDRVLREGLDFVLDEARKREFRVILTLTNFWNDFGGMQEYVQWAGGNNVREFYTNEAVKIAEYEHQKCNASATCFTEHVSTWSATFNPSAYSDTFKDYVASIVTRRSSVTGIEYRYDPTILGWELANEARDPGNVGSKALQGWLDEMAAFIRRLDPNHLIATGTTGLFGPSSPKKLALNAHAMDVFNSPTPSPHRYDGICEGEDFLKDNQGQHVDIPTVHIWPDHSMACDFQCKKEWSIKNLQGHFEAANTLGKPLLLEEFGILRPDGQRHEFYRAMYEELKAAIARGVPVAGALMWQLGGEGALDYGGYTVYVNATENERSRPPFSKPRGYHQNSSVQAVDDLDFRNWGEMMDCMKLKETRNGEEWGETLEVLKNFLAPEEWLM